MPATAADIAAASRDVVTATWTDAAIASRYPTARDGAADPAPGYFDAIADAQTVVNARGALIGAERRRFTATAFDLAWPTVSTTLPCATLVDAEQGTNATCLAARIELDLDAETTTFELLG